MYLVTSAAVGEREAKVKEEVNTRGIWRLLVSEVEGGEAREGYGEWTAIVYANDILEQVIDVLFLISSVFIFLFFLSSCR